MKQLHISSVRQPHDVLAGSFSTNMSSAYVNLAYALEWINFQIDFTGDSTSDADVTDALAAMQVIGDSASADRRRRLQSWSTIVTTATTVGQHMEGVLPVH